MNGYILLQLPTPVPPPSSNSKDEYDHHSSAISSHTHCAITLPPPSLPGGGVIAGSDNLFSLALFSTAGRASVIECLALESITGVGIETFEMLDVTVHGISSTVHGSMTNAHWH